MTGAGFPHSEIPGSMPSRRLPEAYRSHSRLSSVVGAKAFTVGPLLLVGITEYQYALLRTDARARYAILKDRRNGESSRRSPTGWSTVQELSSALKAEETMTGYRTPARGQRGAPVVMTQRVSTGCPVPRARQSWHSADRTP